jgi:hypothetical protein
MEKFIVYRDGFNGANNSSMGARPEDYTQLVATVEADDEDQAVDKALAAGVTCYNGQGIYAHPEEEVAAETAALAAKHADQVLVKYWHGTTALSEWCASQEEIDGCLDLHSNSYPPRFFDADEDEIDYQTAVEIVGGSLSDDEEEEDDADEDEDC